MHGVFTVIQSLGAGEVVCGAVVVVRVVVVVVVGEAVVVGATVVVLVMHGPGTHWYLELIGMPGTIVIPSTHTPAPLGFTSVKFKIDSHTGFGVHPDMQSMLEHVSVDNLVPPCEQTIAIASLGDPGGPSCRKQYRPF